MNEGINQNKATNIINGLKKYLYNNGFDLFDVVCNLRDKTFNKHSLGLNELQFNIVKSIFEKPVDHFEIINNFTDDPVLQSILQQIYNYLNNNFPNESLRMIGTFIVFCNKKRYNSLDRIREDFEDDINKNCILHELQFKHNNLKRDYLNEIQKIINNNNDDSKQDEKDNNGNGKSLSDDHIGLYSLLKSPYNTIKMANMKFSILENKLNKISLQNSVKLTKFLFNTEQSVPRPLPFMNIHEKEIIGKLLSEIGFKMRTNIAGVKIYTLEKPIYKYKPDGNFQEYDLETNKYFDIYFIKFLNKIRDLISSKKL